MGNILAFEGLDNLDQDDPDFSDGRDAVIAADQALYSGSHVCTIQDAFADHGIGSECVLPPAAPTNFAVSGAPSEHPQLSWNSSEGATNYKIYRCSYIYPTCNPFFYIGGTESTSYTDYNKVITSDGCGTGPNEITHYYVRASNSGGDSSPSNDAGTCTEADKRGATTAEVVPEAYKLHVNYPNPFNPSTEIRFDLPEAGPVRLIVYDAMGREVARLVDEVMEAGYRHVTWSAAGVPSGVYLYRLTAGGRTLARSMILQK